MLHVNSLLSTFHLKREPQAVSHPSYPIKKANTVSTLIKQKSLTPKASVPKQTKTNQPRTITLRSSASWITPLRVMTIFCAVAGACAAIFFYRRNSINARLINPSMTDSPIPGPGEINLEELSNRIEAVLSKIILRYIPSVFGIVVSAKLLYIKCVYGRIFSIEAKRSMLYQQLWQSLGKNPRNETPIEDQAALIEADLKKTVWGCIYPSHVSTSFYYTCFLT